MTPMSGGPSLLDLFKADGTLMSNANAKQGIQDMQLLFTLLGAYGVIDKVGCRGSLTDARAQIWSDLLRYVTGSGSRLLHWYNL